MCINNNKKKRWFTLVIHVNGPLLIFFNLIILNIYFIILFITSHFHSRPFINLHFLSFYHFFFFFYFIFLLSSFFYLPKISNFRFTFLFLHFHFRFVLIVSSSLLFSYSQISLFFSLKIFATTIMDITFFYCKGWEKISPRYVEKPKWKK